MSDSAWCQLTILVPQGGAGVLYSALAVGTLQLPEELEGSRDEIEAALFEGGRLVITDEDGDGGNVLGKELAEWTALFPGLDMHEKWGAGGDFSPGQRHCIAGTQTTFRTIDGDRVLTLLELEKIREAGGDLAAAIQSLMPPQPAYPVPDRQWDIGF